MTNSRRLPMHLMTAAAVLVPMVAMAHGISEADRQSMLDGGYLRYISLGASHMLTGYDHLLFLFGVVFFLTGFKDVAKFVTVFTLGHCITLIFATYYKITWNYYLVDAIIALSVIYKGFDNILAGHQARQGRSGRWQEGQGMESDLQGPDSQGQVEGDALHLLHCTRQLHRCQLHGAVSL